MTRDNFADLVRRVRLLYPREKFIDSKDAFDEWYRCLSKLDFDKAISAVELYATREHFAPSISDIHKAYNDIVSKRERDGNEIAWHFDHIRSGYPGGSKAGEKEKATFNRLVYSTNDVQKQKKRAEWLSRKVLEAVDRMDSGQMEYISMIECMERVANNEL